MAYKRPPKTMRNGILFSLILFLSVYGFSQDELGYYNISKKTDDGLMKLIAAPPSYVSIANGAGLSEPYVPMSMNYISLESAGKLVKERYTLNFILTSFIEYDISNGGRLLLKYKDGETLTLATDEEFKGEYRDGLYYVSPEYVITKEQIDNILNKGIIKLRFETQYMNIDVEPLNDRFMVHFKDKINGIEKRKNNTGDSFHSDF